MPLSHCRRRANLKYSQLLLSGQRTHPEGSKVKSRVQVGLSPIRTLHPFWGNFRLGGDSARTEGTQESLKPRFVSVDQF